VLASLNAGELTQRRFREIARVSGLIFQGYPGQPKSTRQLQASSSLFYEVLRKYDAGNLLLGQAEREVLEQELELGRLRAALARMRAQDVAYRHVMQPTPFGFALLVEVMREQLTTEKLGARIERLVQELERRNGRADARSCGRLRRKRRASPPSRDRTPTIYTTYRPFSEAWLNILYGQWRSLRHAHTGAQQFSL
jgi:Lhr-like helicase